MNDARLWNRGFIALFVTQFFEVASDNFIKVLLSFAVADSVAATASAAAVPGGPWEGAFGPIAQGAVGLAFTVPFILLSAFAGRVADRFSKSRTTLILKSISIAVALITIVAFRADSAALAMVAFVFFTIVSSFFGPVKYGMVTELVGPNEVVRANGIINMGTNLAAIGGSVVAGILGDVFADARTNGTELGLWLPGFTMLFCATSALIAALFLPRLSAQTPDLPLDPNPVSTYLSSMRDMRKRSALGVAIAWTYFYFLAAMVLLMLPDYKGLLGVSAAAASALMAIMGVAIGCGCVVAAYLCGSVPNPRFVTAGAVGITVIFVALGVAPPNYAIVAALLTMLGLAAGFYIVPLQAMLQIFAPNRERGRFLGTANAMSFVMGALGAGLYSLLKVFSVTPNRMFVPLAILTAIVSAICFRWGRRLRALLLERATTLPAP